MCFFIVWIQYFNINISWFLLILIFGFHSFTARPHAAVILKAAFQTQLFAPDKPCDWFVPCGNVNAAPVSLTLALLPELEYPQPNFTLKTTKKRKHDSYFLASLLVFLTLATHCWDSFNHFKIAVFFRVPLCLLAAEYQLIYFDCTLHFALFPGPPWVCRLSRGNHLTFPLRQLRPSFCHGWQYSLSSPVLRFPTKQHPGIEVQQMRTQRCQIGLFPTHIGDIFPHLCVEKTSLAVV